MDGDGRDADGTGQNGHAANFEYCFFDGFHAHYHTSTLYGFAR
jgi:hypothetical protein